MEKRTLGPERPGRFRPRPRLHGHVRLLRPGRPRREHRHHPRRARRRHHPARHRRLLRHGPQRDADRRGAARAAAGDQVLISVKFGALRAPDGELARLDARPAAVKNFLAYTLQRLGTDHVDIYRPARLDPSGADRGHGRRHRRHGEGRLCPPHRPLRGRAPRRSAAPAPCIPSPTCRSSIRCSRAASRRRSCRPARELGIGITAYGVLSRGLLSGHWSTDGARRRERLPRPPAALQRRESSSATWRWSRRCARSPGARRAPSRRSPSPGCWRRARTSCRWSARAGATGWPRRSAPLDLALTADDLAAHRGGRAGGRRGRRALRRQPDGDCSTASGRGRLNGRHE